MAMRQFNFKVVDSEDPDAEVPVLVAGQIMIDVQNLLTDVGCLMVRQELRVQSRLPEGTEDRFALKVHGGGQSIGAGPGPDGTLLEDALLRTVEEMDRCNMAAALVAEPQSHIEALGRKRIANDLLALQRHLDGCIMMYGIGDDLRRFRINPRRELEREAEQTVSGMQGAVVGTVSRDPARQGRWIVSDGIDTVPLAFGEGFSGEEALRQSKGGPAIVTGAVVLDEDGDLMSLKDVAGAYPFPAVRFHRIITSERDVPLLNPVEAAVGYNPKKRLWTLSDRDIGIAVAKPSWDEAVRAFHEYFMFLWETYAESDQAFEGEELEVRDLLRSMAFPDLL